MVQPVTITRLKFDSKQFAIDSLIYRGENRLSRTKLARMLNSSPHIINAFEAQRVWPNIEVVVNLCGLTGKNVMDYFK